MDIAPFLKAWLQSRPDITALIGSGHSMRFSPWDESQAQAVPRVSYLLVSGGGEWVLNGPAGLERPRVQLDVWDTDRERAYTLAVLIRGNAPNRRLDGYRGTLAGIAVTSCRCVDVRDNFVSPYRGDAGGIGSVQLDFSVAWRNVNDL